MIWTACSGSLQQDVLTAWAHQQRLRGRAGPQRWTKSSREKERNHKYWEPHMHRKQAVMSLEDSDILHWRGTGCPREMRQVSACVSLCLLRLGQSCEQWPLRKGVPPEKLTNQFGFLEKLLQCFYGGCT